MQNLKQFQLYLFLYYLTSFYHLWDNFIRLYGLTNLNYGCIILGGITNRVVLTDSGGRSDPLQILLEEWFYEYESKNHRIYDL
jgi:hypothetical protein